MEITELLHKRILVAITGNRYFSSQKSTVEEIKILEVSPSENWIKIQNMNGNKFWKNADDIKPVEVLESIKNDLRQKNKSEAA